jgi:hypothetical protein
MPPIMPINPMDPNALQLWNALLGITNPNMVPETTVLQPPGTEPSVPVDSSQYAQLAQAVNADLPNPGQTFNGDAIPQEPIDQKGYPSMEAAVAAQNGAPTGEPPMTPELLAASMSPESTGQGMTEPSLEQPESQGFQSGGLLQNLAMALAAAAPGLMFGARSAGAGGKSYSDELKRQDEDRKLKMQQSQAEMKAILSAMTAQQGRNLRRELSQNSIQSREKEGSLNRAALGGRSDRSFEAGQSNFNRSFEQRERLAGIKRKDDNEPASDVDKAAYITGFLGPDSKLTEEEKIKLMPGDNWTKGQIREAQNSLYRGSITNAENRREYGQEMREDSQISAESAKLESTFKEKMKKMDERAPVIAEMYRLASGKANTLDRESNKPDRLAEPQLRRMLVKMFDTGVMTDVEIAGAIPKSLMQDITALAAYLKGSPDAPLSDINLQQIQTFARARAAVLYNLTQAGMIELMNKREQMAPRMSKSGAAEKYLSHMGATTIAILPIEIVPEAEQQRVMREWQAFSPEKKKTIDVGGSIVLPNSGRTVIRKRDRYTGKLYWETQ